MMTLLNPIKPIRLAWRAAMLKIRRIDAGHTGDYDAAAPTYDAYYSRHLGQASQALFDKLPLRPGMRIADLACGTGFFTCRIAGRVGTAGSVTAVDLSPGMLAQNCATAAGLDTIRFLEMDALDYLRTLDDSSLDGIVCGWGICYMDQTVLRRECERVLRPGGFLGLIENRTDTLAEASALFRDALLEHPSALVKNVRINLPRSHRTLVRTFCKGVLQPLQAWHDSVAVPCKDGEAAVDYMLKSGASAGFLDALDKQKMDAVLASFVRIADRRRGPQGLRLVHECCALIAVKG